MSPHAPSRGYALRAIAAVICLSFPLVFASVRPTYAQQAAGTRALLTLTVNETAAGEALVIVRQGDILVELSTLEKAGLKNVQGRRETLDGRVFVSLASLAPDIKYEFSEVALSLKITATAGHFEATVLNLWRGARPAYELAHATSGFVNYGVDWARATGTTASLETGFSAGRALALNTMSWDPLRGFVRGQSNVTFDQREHLRRWSAGDSLVTARALGSGLLLGGVHVSREYGLDPYFIQFPTLGLSGTALTPSTVEVYVNDRLVSRDQVAPGSFTLANVPMPTGSNDTRVVVRDAFGREQAMTAPYYLTTTVLARGLHEYDYAVGFPRAGGATANWNYGRLSALARHRYGFTNSLTAGFVAEADARTFMTGPTLNLRLPSGEMELSAAASRRDGKSGAAVSAGYARTGRSMSLAARVRAMTQDYSTLTVSRPEDRPRIEASGSVGTRVGPRASVSLQEGWSETHAGVREGRTSIIGSLRLTNRLNAFVNVSGVTQSHDYRTEAFVGISVALGDRTSGSVGAQRVGGKAGVTADVQRSLPLGNGYGYRVQTALGGDSLAEGMVEAQGPYGRYEAGEEVLGGQQTAHISASGGMVAIGGEVRPTRTVADSYALVRVPDVPGVRTYLNNQEMGRTNRRGDLLISNLLPYYANRIGISDQDVPMDHEIQSVERSIAPPFRGGALVVFPIAQHQSMTGTVALDVRGQTLIPAFGDLTVSVGDRSVSSPIGNAGEFYLENLPAGTHPAVVTFKDVTCQLTLQVPASTSPVLRLGIVRCTVPEVK